MYTYEIKMIHETDKSVVICNYLPVKVIQDTSLYSLSHKYNTSEFRSGYYKFSFISSHGLAHSSSVGHNSSFPYHVMPRYWQYVPSYYRSLYLKKKTPIP